MPAVSSVNSGTKKPSPSIKEEKKILLLSNLYWFCMFPNLLWMSSFVWKHFFSCFYHMKNLKRNFPEDWFSSVCCMLDVDDIYSFLCCSKLPKQQVLFIMVYIQFWSHAPSQAGGKNYGNLLFLSQNNHVLHSVVALSCLWTVYMEKSGCKV